MTAVATEKTSALNAELLAQPALRGVLVVAQAKLEEIDAGYKQLTAGDPEGLHDLRVGIRRLRTWLRAYRPIVDGVVRRKTRRALKTLADATGDARDAEVSAEWVARESDPPRAMIPGFRDASKRLEKERDNALASARRTIDLELPLLVSRLKKQLAIPFDAMPSATAAPVPTLREAAAEAVDIHKARLAHALMAVRSVSDVDEAHRARIAGKRLRYVLEPMYAPGQAKAVVAPLVSLQDALGAARDAHKLAMRFVREVGEMAARDARQQALAAIGVDHAGRARPSFIRVRAGLVELARRAHVREEAAFEAFLESWGAEKVAERLREIP